jgi:hypothetical protein
VVGATPAFAHGPVGDPQIDTTKAPIGVDMRINAKIINEFIDEGVYEKLATQLPQEYTAKSGRLYVMVEGRVLYNSRPHDKAVFGDLSNDEFYLIRTNSGQFVDCKREINSSFDINLYTSTDGRVFAHTGEELKFVKKGDRAVAKYPNVSDYQHYYCQFENGTFESCLENGQTELDFKRSFAQGELVLNGGHITVERKYGDEPQKEMSLWDFQRETILQNKEGTEYVFRVYGSKIPLTREDFAAKLDRRKAILDDYLPRVDHQDVEGIDINGMSAENYRFIAQNIEDINTMLRLSVVVQIPEIQFANSYFWNHHVQPGLQHGNPVDVSEADFELFGELLKGAERDPNAVDTIAWLNVLIAHHAQQEGRLPEYRRALKAAHGWLESSTNYPPSGRDAESNGPIYERNLEFLSKLEAAIPNIPQLIEDWRAENPQ